MAFLIRFSSLPSKESAISDSSAIIRATAMVPEVADARVDNMPPAWDGAAKAHRMRLEDLEGWEDFANLAPERHAPAAIIRIVKFRRHHLNVTRHCDNWNVCRLQ